MIERVTTRVEFEKPQELNTAASQWLEDTPQVVETPEADKADHPAEESTEAVEEEDYKAEEEGA
jgi:hypothetical protein